MTNPSLVLTFLGNDLEAGHSTTQTISNQWLVNHSYQPSKQLLNGLKSSSDQIALTIFRKCPSVEDIIATEGNIKAVLKDGDTVVFTGFISTNHNFVVTDHGEQALAITIESIGTRLFSQPFIETGYHFFDSQASAAVYAMIAPLGLSFREGDERKILQPIRREVEAGKTVRELMDSLLYECNAVYWFNNLGELCVEPINPSTSGASVVDSTHLFTLNGKAISLSKSLRTYKGARIRYTETAEASNYLVYRNTTGADDSHPYCNLKLGAGEWYDGGEIYTNAEWSAATADQFREPLLISAVNAGSETEIVGSGKIVAISNAKQKVTADSGITVQIEAVGGKWFKITCHNTSGVDKYITRLDLYADIVYEKTQGIIRTQIDGSIEGKSLLEEELSWIHDKDNAQRHGNLLAQYYKNCGATYTFYSDLTITLGSVIRLIDDTFSGLDVYVLVFASKGLTASELTEYKAVGISTFNLDEPTYHGTTESGSSTGRQGAKGEAGASTEVQYAIGTSLTEPPSSVITWQNEPITWNGEPITWNSGLYSDDVPEQERGKYIWMRTRVGDGDWQYSRLTGSSAWEPRFLGVYDSTTGEPTQTPDGLGLIVGDYFTAGETWSHYTKGVTYKYTGSSWIDAGTDNPSMLLQALSAMKEQGVDFNNLNDPNTISWFATIISDEVIARTIKALRGIFENITVSGKSELQGNVIAEALETYDASDGRTVTFSSTDQLQKSVLLTQLGTYGGYYAESGSITIETSQATITTYATQASPLVISFSDTAFSIKKAIDASIICESLWDGGSYFEIVDGNNIVISALNCSLGLRQEMAGARFTVLKPKNSNSSLGTKTEPIPAGWIGQSDVTPPSLFVHHSYGYTTMANGFQMKWGYVEASENDGTNNTTHSYTTAEGGAFPNDTLLVIASQPEDIHISCEILSAAGNLEGERKFRYRKEKISDGSSSSAGQAFSFIAIGY